MMVEYTVSDENVLIGMGLTPIPTVYSYADGSTIYVSDTVVTNYGELNSYKLEDGMESKGALIYKTTLTHEELK